MPRPLSESIGSNCASERVVISESHDVNDMQLQVALTDPNGLGAPLRSNFDDPGGWEPTETPVDHLSFPIGVSGQTGEIHRMDPVACRPSIKCRKTGALDRTKLGKKIATCRIAGRISRATTSHCPISCPKVEKGTRVKAVLMPLQPCPDVPAGFLGVTCRVNCPPMRRIPMTLRASVRPASRNFPPCLLVHAVPSSLQVRQELWPMCTTAFLCLLLVEEELIPMYTIVSPFSSGFGGARVQAVGTGHCPVRSEF